MINKITNNFMENFNLNKTTCKSINLLEQSSYKSPREPKQINLKDLENCWKNKWALFSEWTEEKQRYKFLYTVFRLFYYSFMQLNENKIASEQSENKDKLDYYVYCIGGNLCGVYNFGKKCIDLIKELKEDNKLNSNEIFFISQFSETRNKIIEHNFNPHNFSYKIDPSFWENLSTDSYLNIKLHGGRENEHKLRIDYYQDYFTLENIFTKIIKSWK